MQNDFLKKIKKFTSENAFKCDDGQPSVMETLDLVLKIYGDDPDLSGNPKYRHMLQTFLNTPYEKFSSDGYNFEQIQYKIQVNKNRAIVALLHDAVDDGKIGFSELRDMGYQESTLKMLEHMRSPKYPKDIMIEAKHALYDEHILNDIVNSPPKIAEIVVPVKKADELHNLSKERMNLSDELKIQFMRKYGTKNLHLLTEEEKKYTKPQDFSNASKALYRKVIKMLEENKHLL